MGCRVERGPAAEGDRGRVHAAVGPHVPARVDPVGGKEHVAGHGDVGRGEAELAAALVAVRDDTAHLVGAPEERVRLGEVAGEQSLADRGGLRHRPSLLGPTVGADQGDALHLEPELGPQPLEERDVAARRCPKWKSSPTTTTLASRQSTSTSCTKSSAVSAERASSKVITRQ